MADLYPVAGAKIFIGPVTATQSDDFEETDFSSIVEDDWIEVDGWESAGAYGDAAEVITTQLINRKRDVKQKGTRNAGSMTNIFAALPGDAGQLDMKAAEKSSSNYAIRIIYDDQPDGGTSGTTHYFVALITGWRNQGGGANTTRMKENTLEINSNIVEVEAA